ncbi:MAG: YebC/PmpR family DNA-binding transcriptional regulator [Lentisphaerae bacterium]|jgi:YebC/PmpR family DNA-binding regulatory protein|nr:YebC/PmpR family DNA-binding transcriptional regulator [Lentisphaerota bacterium]
MSGHSKWATIKHKKGATDAKRGKMFSKLAKEITLAAKSGGDPTMNPTLRTVIQKARSINMPADNIDKAIKKGTGELEADVLEEFTYEGYAAGGIGLVVNVLTDNKNRAAAEIGHIFRRNGTEFADRGAVSRNFERKGQIIIEKNAAEEDRLMEIILEAGADDMITDEHGYEILTEPNAYQAVATAIENAEIATLSSEVAYVPMVTKEIDNIDRVRSLFKFIEALEENDDVQHVYHDGDIADEIMAQIETE